MTNIRPLACILLAAALLSAVGARAQEAPDAVTTFKLPPAPTSTPQPQGPVVEGVTAPRRAVARPAPEPPQGPVPVVVPEPAATAPAAPAPPPDQPVVSTVTADRTGDSNLSTPGAVRRAEGDTTAAAPAGGVPATVSPGNTGNGRFSALPPAPPASDMASSGDSVPSEANGVWNWWFWTLGIFCALWIGGGLFWLWRQRDETGGRIIAPPIERPRTKVRDIASENGEAEFAQSVELPVPTLGGRAGASGTIRPPLRCTIEATRLSLTLMNVTLSYRITLSNETDRAIRGITVGSDLVTAHASLPVDQQLAGSGLRLEPQHRLPLLLPDQNAQLSGELRLPIPAIHPLRRGSAVMFVPLLRLRIDGEGMEEMVLQTLVIGQKPAGPGAGLRPFRLDLGPRIYGEIGHRLLAPQG